MNKDYRKTGQRGSYEGAKQLERVAECRKFLHSHLYKQYRKFKKPGLENRERICEILSSSFISRDVGSCGGPVDVVRVVSGQRRELRARVCRARTEGDQRDERVHRRRARPPLPRLRHTVPRRRRAQVVLH